MRPYVLLDRDGTIIVDKHYLSDPDGVELLPGAAEGMRVLLEAGCGLAVLTNQSGIGRGYYDEAAMHAVNERMLELLRERGVEVDGVFFCPHGPEDGCDCRKPLPGLAERARAELGFDSAASFVVGDKPCDVDLGRAVGAGTVLVRTGKGAKHAVAIAAGAVGACRPDHVADDLRDAAAFIVAAVASRSASRSTGRDG